MNYAQIVDICCKDLRRYLERALKNTRGGVVSVKLSRLLRAALSPPDLARYSRCVSNILRKWRWGSMYVIPCRDAEELLIAFDELCLSVKQQLTVRYKPSSSRRRRLRQRIRRRRRRGGARLSHYRLRPHTKNTKGFEKIHSLIYKEGHV
jgi:hypothetical protein